MVSSEVRLVWPWLTRCPLIPAGDGECGKEPCQWRSLHEGTERCQGLVLLSLLRGKWCSVVSDHIDGFTCVEPSAVGPKSQKSLIIAFSSQQRPGCVWRGAKGVAGDKGLFSASLLMPGRPRNVPQGPSLSRSYCLLTGWTPIPRAKQTLFPCPPKNPGLPRRFMRAYWCSSAKDVWYLPGKS